LTGGDLNRAPPAAGIIPIVGLDVTRSSKQIGDTTDSAAVSIPDFNIFRLQVIDAINLLDMKIREMLAVQAPTCS